VGGLFLGEQSCVLRFASELRLALLLALLLGFVGFCALCPFVCFCSTLERGVCASIQKKGAKCW
jgi:hypothetical protein